MHGRHDAIIQKDKHNVFSPSNVFSDRYASDFPLSQWKRSPQRERERERADSVVPEALIELKVNAKKGHVITY